MAAASVLVPKDVAPGGQFTVTTRDGQRVALVVPPNVLPGQCVTFNYVPLPLTQTTAAVKIQRCYLSYARRRRFRAIVNRAKRRQEYLEERRKIAHRLYKGEAQAQEMKARLAQPRGATLVNRWQGARKADAALRVQTLWRSAKARRGFLKLVAEQEREKAARKLQGFARKKLMQWRPHVLQLSAKDNPLLQPVDAERLLTHEEEILKKRRQYHASMCRGLAQPDLKKLAETKYNEFMSGLPRQRCEIQRTLLHKELTKQMCQALEGRSWEKPLPYGLSSAALFRDASEKHKERMASMAEVVWAVGDDSKVAGEVPMAIESRAEEAESDALLRGLEADLGYDFSLADV